MVDKKRALRGTEPEPSRADESGSHARLREPIPSGTLRRRIASDVISGFERAERPSRRLTGARPRNTQPYADLTAVREEIQAPRRRDSRSERASRPDVEDGFVPEDDVPKDGIPTPVPKLPLGAIPRKKMGAAELKDLPLDHRAGFVLAHIDGRTSMRTLLDVCGMSHEELLEVVSRLLELRAIEVR